MLYDMTRSWLRRILTPLLGLVFAASMSVSTVQATEMAAKMSMATAMSGEVHAGKCPDCNHGSGDTKTMDCRIAVCGAPGLATLASVFLLTVRTDGGQLPVPTQSSLLGWAHAPDPYPPRSRILG